jgi:hypothetical protein
VASIITKSDIALKEWKGAQAGDQGVCGAQSFGAGKFNKWPTTATMSATLPANFEHSG